MVNLEKYQKVYETLANRCEQQRDAKQRDTFLVLAADAAFARGRAEEAERLRMKLLQGSPHSLLRPYATFFEAIQSSDVREYVNELRRQYPPDKAERMLEYAGGAIPLEPTSPPAETLIGGARPAPRLAPALPASKRSSPYENPNFGPKAPAASTSAAPDEPSGWAGMLLAILVATVGISLLGFTLGRPWIPW